jgi:hypothetical protein
VVVGLIVLGAAVFLAVTAYIRYRVSARRWRASEYGAFRVPGETEVMLPVGKVRLSYQESYRASGGREGEIDFGVPARLELDVTSPNGESLDIKAPSFHGMDISTVETGSGWTRALVGRVEVAQAGEYRITARPELEDAVEPQILVGG